jgi:hypothetical protein
MRVLLTLLVLATSPMWAQDSRPAEPKASEPMAWKVGELVPDLTLRGSDGKDHRLRDLTGKRAFVIAWFPKAFTGG